MPYPHRTEPKAEAQRQEHAFPNPLSMPRLMACEDTRTGTDTDCECEKIYGAVRRARQAPFSSYSDGAAWRFTRPGGRLRRTRAGVSAGRRCTESEMVEGQRLHAGVW